MSIIRNLVFKENQVTLLLNNPVFLEHWDQLFLRCPWATVFQSRAFVTAWYRYFPTYPKIIVCDWDGSQMSGIFTLTLKNGQLTGAGLDLAEYQAWLSAPENAESFVNSALEVLQKEFVKPKLYLKYLNHKVPIDIFHKNPLIKNRFVVREYVHPLMSTGAEALERELKKKNKKEKINRLKRIGHLEFFEVKKKEHFASLIDEMILQNEFRKGALYNKTFFYDEPERKDFLLELFDLGLLHVSGLSINGQLIASNAGIKDSKVVHLQGINSHSPFYSKYSPGILHFLKLGIALKKSGFFCFDLTPGGADGYKSSLATENKIAYELWITSKKQALKWKSLENLKEKIKPILIGKKLFGEDLSNLHMAAMRLNLKLRFLKKRIHGSFKGENFFFLEKPSKLVSYRQLSVGLPQNTTKIAGFNVIKVNHIKDLFLFNEYHSLIPRMDFFADCITRIEYGQSMFTITSGAELIGVFWYIPKSVKNSKLNIVDPNRKRMVACSYFKGSINVKFFNVLSQVIQSIEREEVGEEELWVELGKNFHLRELGH